MAVSVYIPDNTKIIHKTKADLVIRSAQSVIHLVQYDNILPIIAVELYQNGEKYAVPNNAKVMIRWKKPDNTYVYNETLGCNNDRTIVYFEVMSAMTVIHGNVYPNVEVTLKGSNHAQTASFPVCIEKSAFQDSDVKSSDYSNVLDVVLENIDKVSSAAASADESAKRAENAASSIQTDLDKKVDKEEGKGLSSNDFTDELKDKINNIESAVANKVVSDITTGSINGTISVTKGIITNSIAVKGLGSAAYTASSDYATSAQGSKADSAVQSAKIGSTSFTKTGTELSITAANAQTAMGLGAAATKGVSTSVDTSANLPTSGAVKTYVDDAIGGITGFDFEVVTALPATGAKGKIYLVAHNHGDKDIYDEYIWVTDKFEKIGSTDVDLSGYLTPSSNANITGSWKFANEVNVYSDTPQGEAYPKITLDAQTKTIHLRQSLNNETQIGSNSILVMNGLDPSAYVLLNYPASGGTIATEKFVTDQQYLNAAAITGYVNNLTGTANNGVITNLTKSRKTLTVASTSLATSDPTASGNSTSFIATITQAANGKITAAKKNLPYASTSTAGILKTTSEFSVSTDHALSLATSGVTAGSYSAVTVNSKGIVTAGGKMIEVGASATATPSDDLAIGGLFFKQLA